MNRLSMTFACVALALVSAQCMATENQCTPAEIRLPKEIQFARYVLWPGASTTAINARAHVSGDGRVQSVVIVGSSRRLELDRLMIHTLKASTVSMNCIHKVGNDLLVRAIVRMGEKPYDEDFHIERVLNPKP